MAEQQSKVTKKQSTLKKKKSTSQIDILQELYQPKAQNQGAAQGQNQQVFMTEVSTTVPATSIKKSYKGNELGMKKQKTNFLHQNSNKNYNSTAQLQKHFIFPSIKKSTSVMSLRAQTQEGSKKRKISKDKLNQLSKPKKEDLNLEEKSKVFEEIKDKKEKIIESTKEAYENLSQGQINVFVQKFENGHSITGKKYDQFVQQLPSKINSCNQLNAQNLRQEQILQQLKDQCEQLQQQNNADLPQENALQEIKIQNYEQKEKVEMEWLFTEQLNHMIERDKLELRCASIPVQEKRDAHQKIVTSIQSIKQLKEKILKEISSYEKIEEKINTQLEGSTNFNETLKNQYIDQYYEQQLFDQVYKNQVKIIEDKEKEKKQKKLEEQKQKDQQKEEKKKTEEKKRVEENNRNEQYQKDFLKLQKECNVKRISDLVQYNEDTEYQQAELKQLTDSLQQKIEDKKQTLQKRKEYLAKMKYQTEGNQQEEQSQRYQDCTDSLDQQHKKSKQKQDFIKKRKKAKEAIAIAIMSIARIATQLKEAPEVTPQNADKILSVCGLRLEHMVATLYKKKPTFNIESVNTDYSSDLPPNFLNIKYAIYVNPPENEPAQENKFENVYENAEKKREKDDENDYLEEKYMKLKKINQAQQDYKDQVNQEQNQGDKPSTTGFIDQRGKIFTNFNLDKPSQLTGQRPETQSTGFSYVDKNQSEKQQYRSIYQILNKTCQRSGNLLLSDNEKEELKTKSQIQQQLMKIVHRTWDIFSPERKQQDRSVFKQQIRNSMKSSQAID